MDLNRKTAYEVLLDMETNQSYSNLALNNFIEKNKPENPAFVRELVYGVLENRMLLDYYLAALVASGLKKVKKQDLTIQFCTAYCGVLSKHTVCATNATGRMISEATGLKVNLFLSHEHGGIEQIGQQIMYDMIDLVLFFNSPLDNVMDNDVLYISRLCDKHSVPYATNMATAELLIHGLARGDLDWREIMNPNRIPFSV